MMYEHAFPKAKEIFSAEEPKYLYHYTNANAFISICDKRQLWSGRPDQMNDFKEQLHAIEEISRLVSTAHRKAGNAGDAVLQNFCERVSQELDIERLRPKMPQFVISLSRDGDLLSQWRAYCPRSGGYSLAIPFDVLKGLADLQEFHLSRCLYDPDEVDEVLSEVLYSYYETYQDEYSKAANYDVAYVAVRDSMLDMFAFYSTFIKHEGFSEENEWRLALLKRADFDMDRMRVVGGEDGIRAFYTLDLDHDNFPSAVPRAFGFHAIIGPNVRPAAARYPAEVAFEKLVGEGNAAVFNTSTTYR
ncbi:MULTISPECIES: DUF2971 domain-containing protein [unclassified Rhodococcus (in: high G+C Gram-positive bacteria)]|uniref:DUF2971 domain-containing protein n=1 Tax=unclassified Rhodococcus (in: high G+C Gram-positive bacteria) TaxID=192944 RepID=UPI00211AD75B|nr:MULTISPECIES: DUF2971 domain-containing protein [unclassified Rhodococcus (in: high G+C Gram-positive bacteria)]